jgi:hypothetical protein
MNSFISSFVCSDCKYETSGKEESYSLDATIKDDSLGPQMKPTRSSAAAQVPIIFKLVLQESIFILFAYNRSWKLVNHMP